MAEDDRDREDDERPLIGGPEKARRDVSEWIDESGDVEQFAQRVSEEMEETLEGAQRDSEKGGGRPRVFTKDQLIEEAAVMARTMYGTVKHSLKMDSYGKRDPDEGYYGLVDIWMIIGHRLDLKYHSRFLRRASYLHWGSRLNRRFVPNYYLFAMRGIDQAIADHYISPLAEHKLQYLFAVKWFLPLGPPLAYVSGVFGPTHEEAHEYARFFEGDRAAPTSTEGEDWRSSISYLRNQISQLSDRFQRKKDKREEYIARYEQTGNEEWKEQADDLGADMEELMEELETLYADYQEAKEEGAEA